MTTDVNLPRLTFLIRKVVMVVFTLQVVGRMTCILTQKALRAGAGKKKVLNAWKLLFTLNVGPT